MKITYLQKTLVPIFSLLLAFGMLAFQHIENGTQILQNQQNFKTDVENTECISCPDKVEVENSIIK